MTALKRGLVGKTKREVTELGLGGAPMGGFRANISDAEAVTLTNAAYDAGVRYFDTSPFYGYGRSELRMGAALREKPRESYLLSTKIGRILHAMKPGEEPPADFRHGGLAGRYTLPDQGALGAFLPECEKRRVSVILGGPYNSGILAGPVKPGATHDYVAAPSTLIEKAQKIEAVCKRHGVELGAAAMQFPLFHPALCAVITGALSVAEVKQNVGRLSAKIPADLWSELKREKLLDPAAPTPN